MKRLSPPPASAGMLEVRGVGLAKIDYVADLPLALVVDLVPEGEVERMPEPEETSICGARVPVMKLDGLQPSAPIKVEMALAAIAGGLDLVR